MSAVWREIGAASASILKSSAACVLAAACTMHFAQVRSSSWLRALERARDASGETITGRVWRFLGFEDDPQRLQAAEMNGWVKDTFLLHMQRSIWLPLNQTLLIFFIGGVNGAVMESNIVVLVVTVRLCYWLMLRADDRAHRLDDDVREDRRAGPARFVVTMATVCGFVLYHALVWVARAAFRGVFGGRSRVEL